MSFYALSKIHLDRYGSFRKILLIFSWNENLNLGPVHGIQNENLLHVLPFHYCKISRDGLCYAKMWAGLTGMSFKKRGIHFIHINMNSILPKFDEVRYIAIISSASIIGISESKLDETFFIKWIRSQWLWFNKTRRWWRGGRVACNIKTSIACSYWDSFCSNIEYLLFDICLPKSKPNLLDILNRPQT